MITLTAILELAKSQVGYLEKKSPMNEDSMIENAGTNNYTKYGRDLVKNIGSPFADGVAWCEMYVTWLFWKLGGKQAVMENLYGLSAYTPTSAGYFKNNNSWYVGKAPKPGYQIFFKNSQRICHTGLVTRCQGGYVYTIEGNTSSSAGVVANGGCVKEKSYPVSYNKIAGYGIPKCFKDNTQKISVDLRPQVKQVQQFLNKTYLGELNRLGICKAPLAVEGVYDKMTRQAILGLWKNHANHMLNMKLDVQNSLFGTQCRAAAGKFVLKRGDTGFLCELAQCLLKVNGFYDGPIDGIFGAGTQKGVLDYQVAHSLITEASGQNFIGQQVWYSLFN